MLDLRAEYILFLKEVVGKNMAGAFQTQHGSPHQGSGSGTVPQPW